MFSFWMMILIFSTDLTWAIFFIGDGIRIEKKQLFFIIMTQGFIYFGERLTFSLQYFRAALTVPLYFDICEKLESNSKESA